jgi:phage terminase small subunit
MSDTNQNGNGNSNKIERVPLLFLAKEAHQLNGVRARAKKAEKYAAGAKPRKIRPATGTELTIKQSLFVKYLLQDPKFNATRAAEKANYVQPESTGCKLLALPKIANIIKEAIRTGYSDLHIAAKRTLSEIATIAYSNMFDYMDVADDGSIKIDFKSLTRAQAAAIQEVHTEEVLEDDPDSKDGKKKVRVRRIRFKLADKLGGLALLAKYQKLIPEEGAQPVTINLLDAIIAGNVNIISSNGRMLDAGQGQIIDG